VTFVNPYNFIHLPPRPESGPLADAPPASHAAYGDGLFSGRIPITIRTLTPLLIPDHARATDPDRGVAKAVATRVGLAGAPLILGSTIKGMVRHYFEAITNSRLGVVSAEHDTPLSIRNGREVFPAAPVQFIPIDHLAAETLSQFSPAERVFGGVAQTEEAGAHRGHLSVGPVRASSQTKAHDVPVRLATLSRPRPEQYLFYLGRDGGRAPLSSGVEKSVEQGYANAGAEVRNIRGRKFYHADSKLWNGAGSGLNGYWDPPRGADSSSAVSIGGITRRREYLAAPNSPAQVSTEFKDWVPAGAEFNTSIQVSNLSSEEVGALLYLLTLGATAPLRLGYGRPLGFGVAQISLDLAAVQLFTLAGLRSRYSSLRSQAGSLSDTELKALMASWIRLVAGSPELSAIRTELIQLARGVDQFPVRYPDLKWWGKNERPERRKPLPRNSRNPALE